MLLVTSGIMKLGRKLPGEGVGAPIPSSSWSVTRDSLVLAILVCKALQAYAGLQTGKRGLSSHAAPFQSCKHDHEHEHAATPPTVLR